MWLQSFSYEIWILTSDLRFDPRFLAIVQVGIRNSKLTENREMPVQISENL